MNSDNTEYCSKCSIKDFCLPVGISLNNLNKLDHLVKEKAIFHKGDILFEAGMTFNCLFVVRSGSFKTFEINDEGEQQIVSFNLPGEILGFDALTDNKHRLSATALETSSICEVSFKNLFLLAAEIPSLQRRLLTLASQRHDLWFISPNKSALAKVAGLLLNLSNRFKNRGLSATEFYLSMSRQDIANLLGLTNETTSRMFSKLTKDGVFKLENRHILELDLNKLAELSHADC